MLSEEKILLSLGVPSGRPIKKRLARYIAEALPLVAEIARPKLAWAIDERKTIEPLLGKSIRLARYLQQPELVALAIGTAGREWEEFVSKTADPMKAFVYAAAATALARDSLIKARRELAQRYPNLTIGDTLSPGTDGLPHRLQSDFARILPLRDLGITFDEESYFMHPLATVTAVIGFGSAVENENPISQCGEPNPRCERCPDRGCLLRVVPFRNNRQPAQFGAAVVSAIRLQNSNL